MKPKECFGYEAKPEIYRLSDGRDVTTYRETCIPLEIMQCRRHKNAEKVCRFFKTPEKFEADARRAEEMNKKRKRG